MWALTVTVLATEPLGWARPASPDWLSTESCAGERQPLDQRSTATMDWAVRTTSCCPSLWAARSEINGQEWLGRSDRSERHINPGRPFPNQGLTLIGPFGPWTVPINPSRPFQIVRVFVILGFPSLFTSRAWAVRCWMSGPDSATPFPFGKDFVIFPVGLFYNWKLN